MAVHGGRDEVVQHPQVWAGPIGGYLDRCRTAGQRPGREAAGSSGVPLLQ